MHHSWTRALNTKRNINELMLFYAVKQQTKQNVFKSGNSIRVIGLKVCMQNLTESTSDSEENYKERLI